jgi:hypothetical protein
LPPEIVAGQAVSGAALGRSVVNDGKAVNPNSFLIYWD